MLSFMYKPLLEIMGDGFLEEEVLEQGPEAWEGLSAE